MWVAAPPDTLQGWRMGVAGWNAVPAAARLIVPTITRCATYFLIDRSGLVTLPVPQQT